jgi:hypothetical protein
MNPMAHHTFFYQDVEGGLSGHSALLDHHFEQLSAFINHESTA